MMVFDRPQNLPQLFSVSRFHSWALAAVLAGCVSAMPAQWSGFTTVAQAQEVQKFSNPSRLVAVGGALSEIIYALGEEGKLIARDQTSIFPEAVKQLPDVGYMRNLSAEGVLSVAPTAMLVVEGSGPPETIEVLQRASVPMIIVPEVYSAEGIVNKINRVGTALGVPEKAAQLAKTIGTELQQVADETAKITDKKRVLFVLSRQGGRLMVSGQGTAADQMIKMAGGINAVQEFNGYKQITDEALDAAAPDLILLMNTGSDKVMDDHSGLFSNLALAATPAGRNQAVLAMDGLYLLGFGPRTAAAARELSEALYGKHTQ